VGILSSEVGEVLNRNSLAWGLNARIVKNTLYPDFQLITKTPLLDRRGAETDERSDSGSAGWWIADTHVPCHPECVIGGP